jgi:uncharacterized membrane protein
MAGVSPRGARFATETRSGRPRLETLVQQSRLGPLPAPEILRAYNEIEPGFASRVITMAEDQSKVRREVTLLGATAQVERMRRDYMEGRIGQVCAVLVVAMTTFGAVYAGIHGAQITGSFLGVGGLGTIVATFISGRKLPAKTQDGGD